MSFTYKDSGVDHSAKIQAIKRLTGGFEPRKGFGGPMEGIGNYASLIDFGDVALVLCTDGVGTKIMVADEMRKWDTIGIDCVAMNVNDLICVGAEPLAFVDYIAVDDPTKMPAEELGKGLAEGARQSNMSIVGGETAVLPDMVKGFDISGTAMGYVKKEDIISGELLREGDVVLGVPSSGIHSNGLTLARKIVKERGLSYHSPFAGGRRSLGLELLEPTRIYVPEVLSMLRKFRKKVHGLYNITGGGLGNLLRLNDELGMEITHPLEPQPIFKFLMSQGVTEQEMYHTFNMGMGFTVVAERSHAGIIAKELGPGTRPVGSVIGEHVIRRGDLSFFEY